MKSILVDARSLNPLHDGLGSYLREVVPRIASRATDLRVTVIANPAMLEFWHSAAPRAGVLTSDCRPMWPEQHVRISRLLRRLKPELYFYPAHDPPLIHGIPFVFTIHDVIRHQVRPAYERMDRVKTAFVRTVTHAALWRAAKVLTVSEATKAAIGQIFGERFLGKIRVVPNGASEAPASATLPEGHRRCLLYVGSDRPHKNLDRLILGYAAALRRFDGLPPLELVGPLRRGEHLREVIARAQLGSRVVLRGYVSDEELERTYARAIALVLPSLYEGFGLPILEAMCRTIPVVASDRSACAEVAGNAAVLVDPVDIESIAQGLLRVTTDARLRAELRDLGMARVSLFSWDKCAADTLEVLRAGLESA